MSIGLLVIFNFLTVPFVHEAEKLGQQNKKFPKLIDILKLKNTLHERWLKLYGIFVGIIIFGEIVRSAKSAKSFPAGWGHIVVVLAIQVIIWIYIAYRIKQSK